MNKDNLRTIWKTIEDKQHKTDLVKVLIDNADIIINIWTLDGKLLKFNKYAQTLTGFSEEEVLGDKWRGKIVDENVCGDIDDLFTAFQNMEFNPAKGKLLNKKGEIIEVLWSNNFVQDKNEQFNYALSIGMNITENKNYEKKLEESYNELKKSYDEIERLALYDTITGLPNLTNTQLEIEKMINEASLNKTKFALLLMDIDNFKVINDTLGHPIGDKLLKNIAAKLREYPLSKFYCSRFGGDEFIFLLKNIKSEAEVNETVNNILNNIKSIVIDSIEFNNTASFGVVIYPENGLTVEELMKNSDIALYRAKELGKNTVCIFDESLNLEVIHKIQFEKDLKKSISNNELIIYYQPQIDAFNNNIIGVEALLRWIHPIQGMISPLKFIPVAEEIGFINELGEWVLREACKQLKHWNDRGFESIKISINLSLKQLQDSSIVKKVEEIISETGVKPEKIVLEITESISMNDVEKTIKLLNDLRKIGVRIALDDFGTGYSSLNYLTNLPINIVKLDKTFMNDIVDKYEKQVVTKSILELAEKLNLVVVAEGVETKKQLNLLKKFKCGLIQGFLFSKPLPVCDFEKLYLSQK